MNENSISFVCFFEKNNENLKRKGNKIIFEILKRKQSYLEMEIIPTLSSHLVCIVFEYYVIDLRIQRKKELTTNSNCL